MNELGFKYCYTPVVSPRYNPIEETFGIAKAKIKKKRLNKILNNTNESLNKIIISSFNEINT